MTEARRRCGAGSPAATRRLTTSPKPAVASRALRRVPLKALDLGLLLLHLLLARAIGQLAELGRDDRALAVLMDDVELDRRAGLGRGDLRAQRVVVLHRLAGERDDHVAFGEPGACGGAARLDAGDQ